MRVKISDKFQVVIPKAARKQLQLSKQDTYLEITQVTDHAITFSRALPPHKNIMKYAGVVQSAWGKKPVAELRRQRDQEWE